MSTQNKIISPFIQEAAALWYARLAGDAVDSADWQAFTIWLEASHEHARAFELMDLLALEIETQAPALQKHYKAQQTNAQNIQAPQEVLAAFGAYARKESAKPEASPDRLKQWLRRSFMPTRGHPKKFGNLLSGFTAIASPRLSLAAGLAVSLLVGGVIALPFLQQSFQAPAATEILALGDHYSTAYGEQKEIALADGSRVNLNINSQMDVQLSPDRRDIFLVEGEAIFDVAPDKDRPFYVHLGDSEIRVLGTRFNVVRSQGQITVTVDHGLVEVTGQNAQENAKQGAINTLAFTEKLSKGQQLRRIEGDNQPIINLVDPDDILSWQDHILTYEDSALGDVVYDLNRYFPAKISVDAASAQLSFSGILATQDLDSILGLLEASMPLNIEKNDAQISLKSRVK